MAIGLLTRLQCIDNSGASIVKCIGQLKRRDHGKSVMGDEIVVVVKRARQIFAAGGSPGGAQQLTSKVKKGDIRRAVIVRTRKEFQRPDGRFVKFDDNACVLLNFKGEMVGTRVLGTVSAELRRSGRWGKILALSPKVV